MLEHRPNARPIARLTWLIALGALAVPTARPAAAAWPPPESATAADMKNPANWPNDPGYGYVPALKPGDRKDGQQVR